MDWRKALDWLAKGEPNNTYIRGIRANVWEYALRKLPGEERFGKLLKTDYEWLLAAMGKKEGWRYCRESTDWDNSCTQYGVLGIWAAARGGLEPGDKFWTTLSKHFRRCQNRDGGWGYTPGSGSSPNMATAGLASMFLVFDMYHGKSAYSKVDPRTFTTGDAAEVLKAIDRGMEWLGKAQGNKNDGYYLYGVERTGVASGRKLLGGEDWFDRGALAVLQAQRPDGSIPLGSWGGPEVSTCFCTLFLVYGGAPVAYNKLQFGKDQDWDLNPRDLANVSKALWSAYERPINWQIVSIDSPAAEIEAPVLFLSGSKRWAFTEKEMLKLREYVERGGTILAEPSDHSAEFAASMEDLLKNMYPPQSYPDHGLAPLPADHAVYTVIKQDWKNRPRLRGATNGSRTFFLLSDEYLSGDWQANREESDAFKLAMNLLFYATDLGELEGKFSTMLPSTPAAQTRQGSLTVARIHHGGTKEHPQDWEAAAACWTKLAPLATHLTGRSLKEAPPVVLGKDSVAGVRLLHSDRADDLAVNRGGADRLEAIRAIRRHAAGGCSRRIAGLCPELRQGGGGHVWPVAVSVGRSGVGRGAIRRRRGFDEPHRPDPTSPSTGPQPKRENRRAASPGGRRQPAAGSDFLGVRRRRFRRRHRQLPRPGLQAGVGPKDHR